MRSARPVSDTRGRPAARLLLEKNCAAAARLLEELVNEDVLPEKYHMRAVGLLVQIRGKRRGA